jgi:hypothetical protein
MNQDQMLWKLVGVLMFLFCCHSGLLIYFCRYLKSRGVADVSFTATLIMALTGNIQKFYKAFYVTHSKEYGKTITKILIFWQFSSVGLIIVLPVIFAFVM